MKPFKTCPGCNSDFKRFEAGNLFMESCKKACTNSAVQCEEHNCPIQFRQQFKASFEGELTSIQFYTKHFNIHHHTADDGIFPNMTHIYTRHFPRGASTMAPIFRVPDLTIDFNKVEELDKKYFTLSLFI